MVRFGARQSLPDPHQVLVQNLIKSLFPGPKATSLYFKQTPDLKTYLAQLHYLQPRHDSRVRKCRSRALRITGSVHSVTLRHGRRRRQVLGANKCVFRGGVRRLDATLHARTYRDSGTTNYIRQAGSKRSSSENDEMWPKSQILGGGSESRERETEDDTDACSRHGDMLRQKPQTMRVRVRVRRMVGWKGEMRGFRPWWHGRR